MKEKPQSVDSTRPHWMCQNPHGFPCIVLKGVLNGDLKPCSVCEDSVDDMRDLLTTKHTRILPTKTVAAPSGSQPDSVVCSDWLDALSESVESAEKIKLALIEVDDRELAADVLLLQEHLKELRRQMGSASSQQICRNGK